MSEDPFTYEQMFSNLQVCAIEDVSIGSCTKLKYSMPMGTSVTRLGLFLKDKFSYQNGPKIWQLFWVIFRSVIPFKEETVLATFRASFGKIWLLLISTSGHTGGHSARVRLRSLDFVVQKVCEIS